MDQDQSPAAAAPAAFDLAPETDGRRKPRGARRTADVAGDDPGTGHPISGPEHVTYVPGPDDPPQVKWRGLVFRANVPRQITHGDHIEAARGNRFFHVGSFDPERHGKPTIDVVRKPIDGKTYRAHVVAWLKKVDSAEDLVQRWAGDEAIRNTCEDIGTDDYMWLGSLIEPRFQELVKRDEIDPAHETALWARYGVTVIPWRTENNAVATSG